MTQNDTPTLSGSVAQDVDVLLVFNIIRSGNYLLPHIDRDLRCVKMGAAGFNVLLLLHDTKEGGMPLSEIGRRLVVSKANVTGLIDRLEKKGYVRRERTSDRRVSIARLTAEGRNVVETLLPTYRRAAGLLVDCLDATEKQQLNTILRKLRRGIRHKVQKSKRDGSREPGEQNRGTTNG